MMKKLLMVHSLLNKVSFCYETDTDITNVISIVENMKFDDEFYAYIFHISSKLQKNINIESLDENFRRIKSDFLSISDFEKFIIGQEQLNQVDFSILKRLTNAIREDIAIGITERILCNNSTESELYSVINKFTKHKILQYSVERNQRASIENKEKIQKDLDLLQEIFDDVLMGTVAEMSKLEILRGVLSLYVLNRETPTLDILLAMYMGTRDYYERKKNFFDSSGAMKKLKDRIRSTGVETNAGTFDNLESINNECSHKQVQGYSCDEIENKANKNYGKVSSISFNVDMNPKAMDMEMNNPLYISNLKSICTKFVFVDLMNSSVLNVELMFLDEFIAQCVEFEYRLRFEEKSQNFHCNEKYINSIVDYLKISRDFLSFCCMNRNEFCYYLSMNKTYHEIGIVACVLRKKNIGIAVDNKLSYETFEHYMGNAAKYIVEKRNLRTSLILEKYEFEKSMDQNVLDELMVKISNLNIDHMQYKCTKRLLIEFQLLKGNDIEKNKKALISAWESNCDRFNIQRRLRTFFKNAYAKARENKIMSKNILREEKLENNLLFDIDGVLLNLQEEYFAEDWKKVLKIIGKFILTYNKCKSDDYLDEHLNYRQKCYLAFLLEKLAEDMDKVEDLYCMESWQKCRQEWADTCELES